MICDFILLDLCVCFHPSELVIFTFFVNTNAVVANRLLFRITDFATSTDLVLVYEHSDHYSLQMAEEMSFQDIFDHGPQRA